MKTHFSRPTFGRRLFTVLGLTFLSAAGMGTTGGEVASASPSTPPAAPQFELVEGDSHEACTNVSSELIDARSSSPRLIVWADCGGSRFSIVSSPTVLPGSPPVQAARFSDIKTGEEWEAAQAKIDVTELGAVGAQISGSIDLTMRPRLNEPTRKLHAEFHAPRTKDRHSP